MKGVQAPEEVHGAKSSIFEESGTQQILSPGFGLLLFGHWFQTSATPTNHSQWNLLFAWITLPQSPHASPPQCYPLLHEVSLSRHALNINLKTLTLLHQSSVVKRR